MSPLHTAPCCVPLALHSLQKSHHFTLVSSTYHDPSTFLRTLPGSSKGSETEFELMARSWMPPHCTIRVDPLFSFGSPYPTSPPSCPELFCGKPGSCHIPNLNQGQAAQGPGFHGSGQGSFKTMDTLKMQVIQRVGQCPYRFDCGMYVDFYSEQVGYYGNLPIVRRVPRKHWRSYLMPTGHSFLDGVTHLMPL